MKTLITSLAVALFLTLTVAVGSSSASSSDTYRFVQTWGDVPGSAWGELARPTAIAVGPYGDAVYVADTFNDRVQVFYPEGVPYDVPVDAYHALSVTTTRAGDWFVLEPRRGLIGPPSIVRFSQKTDVAQGSWNPPAVVNTLHGPPQIAASDWNGGVIFGLGFCTGCDHPWDVVTRWDSSGRVTGSWDLHVDPGSHLDEWVSALATDRQGNFYIARVETHHGGGGLDFVYGYDRRWEWVEKYGSSGQLVAQTEKTEEPYTDKYGYTTGDFEIRSLAVDPNTGVILTKSKHGIFALSANFKDVSETGIPSDDLSQIAVDCRSNVYVLSQAFGGVSRYVPPRRVNSCLRRPPSQSPAVTLVAPRTKNPGSRHPSIVESIACAGPCRGTLTAKTTAVSHMVIGQARFRLPVGGRTEIDIPLNGRGRRLAAAGGALKVSVSAALGAGPGRPSTVVGMLKDPSAALLACPRTAQTVGLPFAVSGKVTPANSQRGRVQIAFGRNAAVRRSGYLDGAAQSTTARSGGWYDGSLTADQPGVWRIQLVSLGDDIREASHSAVCMIDVTPAPTSPQPPQPPTAAVPVLAVEDVSIKESDSGTNKLEFSVSLSAVSAKAVTVVYATADGTALAGSDYQATGGTLTFDPGETRQQLSVKVIGDSAVEPDETLKLALSSPVNATIGRATATGTIRNDDTAVSPPPPPVLPDLVVSSIDGLAAPGENLATCQISFTITNIGSAAAGPSTAQVRAPTGITTVAVATASTHALAPGQSDHEQATLPLDCGVIAVTVTADATSAVTESDESNNVRQGP